MKIYGRYWKQESSEKNFGDLVVPKLVEAYGHEYVPYKFSINAPFCLFGGASILHPRWFSEITSPLIVWGAGARGNWEMKLPENTTVTSVRGPKTRKLLSLDCPLGDPGFLMEDLVPNSFKKDLEPALVTHYNDKVGKCSEARRIIPTKIAYSQFESVIEQIARSKFCLVNSLHAAIACIVYDVPWALCPIMGQVDTPFKWEDLGEYLEIPIFPIHTLRAGELWYSKYGQRFVKPDVEAIRKAFPF
jgi:hypothetical protein